jgi:hypothetical protein
MSESSRERQSTGISTYSAKCTFGVRIGHALDRESRSVTIAGRGGRAISAVRIGQRLPSLAASSDADLAVLCPAPGMLP